MEYGFTQKYPGKKYFKGPKAGQYSCNPLGKNPGDVWVIPNVKSNHVEKTEHPCQFPVELIERLVLAFTNKDDLVRWAYLSVGTGTSIIAAAVQHFSSRNRGRAFSKNMLRSRVGEFVKHLMEHLEVRPMNQPVFDPKNAEGPTSTSWLLKRL